MGMFGSRWLGRGWGSAALCVGALGCVGGEGGGGGGDGGATPGPSPQARLGGGPTGSSVRTSVPRSRKVTGLTAADGLALCKDSMSAVQSRINARQFCTFLAIQGAATDPDAPPDEDEAPPTPASCQEQVTQCEGFITQFLTPALCDQAEQGEPGELPEHCARVTVGDVADCFGARLDQARELGRGWTCNDVSRADSLALGDDDAPPEPPICAAIDAVCPELNGDDDAEGSRGFDDPGGALADPPGEQDRPLPEAPEPDPED